MLPLILVLAVLAFGFSLYTFLRTPKMGEHTHAPISIVDMAEWRGMPAQLKQAYVENVVHKIAPAFHKTIANAWASGTDDNRTRSLQAISENADAFVLGLNKMDALIAKGDIAGLMKTASKRR